jgi:hypothetical protein
MLMGVRASGMRYFLLSHFVNTRLPGAVPQPLLVNPFIFRIIVYLIKSLLQVVK